MRDLLYGLLPRLYPDLTFLCLVHEGKSDLEKSIPRKLRAWREPGVRFVVLRDNDGDDCMHLKQKLARICQESGRADTLVRIVCQELEAWYLGEPDALADAFEIERLREIGRKSSFPRPGRSTATLAGSPKACARVPKGKRRPNDGEVLVTRKKQVEEFPGSAVRA